MFRSFRMGFALAAFAVCWLLSPQVALADAHPLLAEILRDSTFTKAEIQGIGDAAIARELSIADSSRGAAFAGIIKLRTDGSGLASALTTGNRAATAAGADRSGRFRDPAQPADVASLEFSDSDLEVLADCQVASCKFKLGRDGIESLSTIDWNQTTAGAEFTERFRKQALSYVDAYRKQGNAALVLYEDKATPVPLASTVETIMAQFTGFKRHAPAFSSYLLSYPEGRTPGMADAIVWAIEDFGYRPTLAIDHVIADQKPELEGATALIATKTIYTNHYLAGRIQMGVVLDGSVAFGIPGHYIVLVDRIQFDDVLGGFKRSLLGRGLLSDVEKRMTTLRALADGPS